MMARSLREKSKSRKDGSRFIGLPEAVVFKALTELSGNELKILLGITNQYRGSNNGDLTATAKQAKAWRINSQTTLANALRALEDKQFIIKTRQGVFMNPNSKPSLYAIGWKAIDECKGKLDVSPTNAPPIIYTATTTLRNNSPSPNSGA